MSRSRSRVDEERSLAVKRPQLAAELHPTKNPGVDPYASRGLFQPAALVAVPVLRQRLEDRAVHPTSNGPLPVVSDLNAITCLSPSSLGVDAVALRTAQSAPRSPTSTFDLRILTDPLRQSAHRRPTRPRDRNRDSEPRLGATPEILRLHHSFPRHRHHAPTPMRVVASSLLRSRCQMFSRYRSTRATSNSAVSEARPRWAISRSSEVDLMSSHFA
jgi:hypothetical protein